ncbi:Spherulin-1B [Pyrenophora teres f. maculata]|nr:Spherulin-1B [Pyrenophora teres f. maculata]
MLTIANIVVAALALGTVQALPQAKASHSVSDANATTTSSAPPAATSSNDQAQLFRDLFTAPTAIKRFQRLLTNGGQTLFTGDALRKMVVFPFDSGAPSANSPKNGALVAANIESFPILTDLGISTTVGFLSPCSINTPHVHPRATEFLTLVEGSNLEFGYVLENNLVQPNQNPEIAGYLNKFQGTVFPQGSIHFQFNNNCENAVFVATLNSEDPGTSQVAQNFFALNDNVVNATLGFPSSINGVNIEEFRKYIPANLASGMDACMSKCKSKDSQY